MTGEEPDSTGRVMGLDHGTTRIGVALSDGLGLAAHPHSVMAANDRTLGDQIVGIVAEYQIDRIVVGLPTSLDGGERGPAVAARSFADRIGRLVDVPVEMYDERFTSNVANRVLLEAGASRAKRRSIVDKIAASVMLQGYLDHRRQAKLP